MPKRLQSDRGNGSVSLAADLAKALRDAEARPPWERDDLTADQKLEVLLTLVGEPTGSRWRYPALEKLQWLLFQARDEIPDWQARYRRLMMELEDEEIFSDLPRRHHVCDPSRCNCVPAAPRLMSR